MNTARLLATLLLGSLASCATMVSGSSSKVELQGRPGAAFATSSGQSGHVPATVDLPNGQTVDISYDSNGDGVMDASHQSVPSQDGSIAGNILMGGLVGLVVDAANPNTKTHKSPQVLGAMDQLALTPEVLSALEAQGISPEQARSWTGMRRSQAQVRLSDREFKLWDQYNEVVKAAVEAEKQAAMAQSPVPQS